jgi:hypothetical protein
MVHYLPYRPSTRPVRSIEPLVNQIFGCFPQVGRKILERFNPSVNVAVRDRVRVLGPANWIPETV